MELLITIKADLTEEQAECFRNQPNGILAVGDELAQAETVKDILRNPTDENVKLNWTIKHSLFKTLRRMKIA